MTGEALDELLQKCNSRCAFTVQLAAARPPDDLTFSIVEGLAVASVSAGCAAAPKAGDQLFCREAAPGVRKNPFITKLVDDDRLAILLPPGIDSPQSFGLDRNMRDVRAAVVPESQRIVAGQEMAVGVMICDIFFKLLPMSDALFAQIILVAETLPDRGKG